ncbi:MAG TPA: hypothetical protein DCL74_07125 [Succinivibrionaceae bacterium]|nr:hypothetical protein [Succinivibrionaceae bacterium]
MSFFQDVKKIKVSDLILWSENPRDPISKEADNNAIIKHALEDKNNVWKLREFAKDMGDLYFYSELPTVVYKDNSPIVYDGNRRVILANLSLGFFNGDSSIRKYPYVEQEMPCNVCDENTALQYVLRKHSERGGWKPLDRDFFCYKYLGKKKSVFLIINDLLDDYINLHPDINKVFVKDELLSANKLSKLNIDIDSSGFISCPYTLDELKKIIINLLDQVSNGFINTRSNRGDVYTILDDDIKNIIELKKDGTRESFFIGGKGNNYPSSDTRETGYENRVDNQTDTSSDVENKKQVKKTSFLNYRAKLFGEDLSLIQSPVNNLYRDLQNLYKIVSKQKEKFSEDVYRIFRVSLRLLVEMASSDSLAVDHKTSSIDDYVNRYFEKAHKYLSTEEKNLLSAESINQQSLIKLLQQGAHGYQAEKSKDKVVALAIIIGKMLSISHGK